MACQCGCANPYRPAQSVYRAQYAPNLKINLSGRADDPQWSLAVVEKQFIFPWNNDIVAPRTEFRALCGDTDLFFAFDVDDADIVVVDQYVNKMDVIFEDRVELFFSLDDAMSNYYCLEIDPLGRTLDYHCSFYRKFDRPWTWPGLETKASLTPKGYVVEGRLPLVSFEKIGFPRLRLGAKILCGIYRAEFSHDRSGRPVEKQDSIHHQDARKLEGPPPIENWLSWVNPKTPEPDFHVPSSLGWLEIV
jgi:hypothetical protein